SSAPALLSGRRGGAAAPDHPGSENRRPSSGCAVRGIAQEHRCLAAGRAKDAPPGTLFGAACWLSPCDRNHVVEAVVIDGPAAISRLTQDIDEAAVPSQIALRIGPARIHRLPGPSVRPGENDDNFRILRDALSR